jgi:AcrR family transcriptional regulator
MYYKKRGAADMIDKKAEIWRCAKELFSTKGFKDTNVAEITKMAGMATGTFYNYYTSKDQLFMELHIEENIKLKRSMMETVNLDADPLSVVKEMVAKNLQGMVENPILREWFNRDVFQKIEQCYREANGLEYINFLYDFFIEVVKKWQITGAIRNDISAEMIMAIFNAIINVETHKEEVGFQYFPQVLDYLTEFTMKGLMEPVPKNDEDV